MERWKVSSKMDSQLFQVYRRTFKRTLCTILCMIPHDKIETPIQRLYVDIQARFEFFRAQMHALGLISTSSVSVKVSESQQTNLPIDTVALRVDGLDSLVQSAVRSASFDVISPRENIPTIKISPLWYCVLRCATCVQ